MTPLGKAPGAHFEISIEGKPRSYRDRKSVAIAAAEHLKRRHPNSEVVAGTSCAPHTGSQAERRRVLREDRLATTYHSASRAFAEENRGGRFAVLEKAKVTGIAPGIRVPMSASLL